MKNEDGISAIAMIIIIVLIAIVIFIFLNLNTDSEKVENEVAGYIDVEYENIIDENEVEAGNVSTIEIDTSDMLSGNTSKVNENYAENAEVTSGNSAELDMVEKD